MSDRAITLLLILAIAVTPSVSDAVQLHLTDPKWSRATIGWWLLLIAIICLHGKRLD
jgi:hypothetical protein